MKTIIQLSNKEKIEILVKARVLIKTEKHIYICTAILAVLLSKKINHWLSSEEVQEQFNMNLEEARHFFEADGDNVWWNILEHNIKECRDLRIKYINHLIKKLQ